MKTITFIRFPIHWIEILILVILESKRFSYLFSKGYKMQKFLRAVLKKLIIAFLVTNEFLRPLKLFEIFCCLIKNPFLICHIVFK